MPARTSNSLPPRVRKRRENLPAGPPRRAAISSWRRAATARLTRLSTGSPGRKSCLASCRRAPPTSSPTKSVSPAEPDHAAKQLLDATPVRIALGALERPDQPRRHFVLMAGVGLDARIVYELDLDLKGKLGKLAYWHGGFRQFGRPVPRFRLAVNGAEYCASFALITRTKLWRRFRDRPLRSFDRRRF